MLLKAAIGAQLLDEGSDESLGYEKSMDIIGTSLYLYLPVPQYM